MKPKINREKQCRKCRAMFHAYYNEELCQDCIHSLLKCFSCGIICAPAWGYFSYSYPFTLANGKEVSICGDCRKEMKKRGYLLADGWKVMADGSKMRVAEEIEEERSGQFLSPTLRR